MSRLFLNDMSFVFQVDGKAGPADVCVIELGGTVGR